MHEGQMTSILIRQGYHSSEEKVLCACKGTGWILSPFDVWEPCPLHPSSQHPEEDYPEEDDISAEIDSFSPGEKTIQEDCPF